MKCISYFLDWILLLEKPKPEVECLNDAKHKVDYFIYFSKLLPIYHLRIFEEVVTF